MRWTIRFGVPLGTNIPNHWVKSKFDNPGVLASGGIYGAAEEGVFDDKPNALNLPD